MPAAVYGDLALTEFLYASVYGYQRLFLLTGIALISYSVRLLLSAKVAKSAGFYLSEVCAEYLRQYLNSRIDDNPALFAGIKAPYKRLTKEGVEFIVKSLGKKAGVSNVHPHRFGGPWQQIWSAKVYRSRTLLRFLGHSDLRTTQVYVALDQSTVKYHYSQAVA